MNFRKFFFGIAILALCLIAEDLCAQTKPSTKTVDLIYQNEEENLQVFHQWIRWNNPGSLLMNHLIKLASYHFDLRDQEIAKLTTPTAWSDRQQIVELSFPRAAYEYKKAPSNIRISNSSEPFDDILDWCFK